MVSAFSTASSTASAAPTNTGNMRSFGQSAIMACAARRAGVRRSLPCVRKAMAVSPDPPRKAAPVRASPAMARRAVLIPAILVLFGTPCAGFRPGSCRAPPAGRDAPVQAASATGPLPAPSSAASTCAAVTPRARMSFSRPSLVSPTTALTLTAPGLRASVQSTSASTALPTARVLVSTMGVSSAPSSASCVAHAILPKPLMTESPAGTRSV